MVLTVAELASAVNKSEIFVRQHIHRKHLLVQREGRNVTVAAEEAARWARERGLALNLPARTSVSAIGNKGRTARMTVLTWHPQDGQTFNLFTLIRHRRWETLGPWANEPDETWSCKVFPIGEADHPEELRLHSLDAPYESCQNLVYRILDEGALEIDGLVILYSLEPIPRQHWGYRDLCRVDEHAVLSPFSRHSAEVLEYWSFATEPRERWVEETESDPTYLKSLIATLSFPLDKRSDRVGNLMIAGAEDAIYCELVSHRNKDLILRVDRVDGDLLPPDAYTAVVWASHSGNNVVHRKVAVNWNETVINVQSDVDHSGFAVYRNIDGRLVDYWEVYLTMGLSIGLNIVGGSTLELRERKRSAVNQVSLGSSKSIIEIDPSKNSNMLDDRVRREFLDRNIRQREVAAREGGKLERFAPGRFDEAVKYFLSLLHKHTYSTEPIYLADPYLFKSDSGDSEKQFCVGLLEATNGRPLRILTGVSGMEPERTVWPGIPPFLTKHTTIRAFTKPGWLPSTYRPAFHDRYLITRDQEILISHSINGWSTSGVTFASLPYGVYRAEAEKLWAMEIGTTEEDVRVWEIK